MYHDALHHMDTFLSKVQCKKQFYEYIAIFTVNPNTYSLYYKNDFVCNYCCQKKRVDLLSTSIKVDYTC